MSGQANGSSVATTDGAGSPDEDAAKQAEDPLSSSQEDHPRDLGNSSIDSESANAIEKSLEQLHMLESINDG